MNRRKMQEIIKERVPYLVEQHQEKWKESESQRQAFVRDYPIDQIRNLTLDEYVIGKGADNRSFCYRIEYDLYHLGIISGAFATKYGVWYGQYGEGTTNDYQFIQKFGTNLTDAFQSLKSTIVELLENPNDLDKLRKNKLSPMFKGKILFLYHPEEFLNIYAKTHLSYFTAHLNLLPVSEKELDLQKALMDYKATWPELQNVSPFLYAVLLYDLFGYPPKDDSQKIPLLSTAVTGANFNTTLTTTPPNSQNPGYEELQKNRKIIGDRGEKIVLELEKKRLQEAGRDDLARSIVHVSDTDDSRGFDILSFDGDGKERQIEVKSTSMDSFYKGFFLTANELEKSNSLDNYYLYLVSSAMTDKPVINTIAKPLYSKPEEFTLSPVLYNVRLNNMEAKQ